MKFLFNLLNAAQEAVPTEEAINFFFEPSNFSANLKYMGTGMLVIFAVIGIIILATLLINKIFSK